MKMCARSRGKVGWLTHLNGFMQVNAASSALWSYEVAKGNVTHAENIVIDC